MVALRSCFHLGAFQVQSARFLGGAFVDLSRIQLHKLRPEETLLEAARLELIVRSSGREDGCIFSIQVRPDFSLFQAFFATRRAVKTLLKSTASEAFLKVNLRSALSVRPASLKHFLETQLPWVKHEIGSEFASASN